ncbi:MAG: tRNA lysidine(34) synthetase TilS [Rickettsiaceae bacterium]|nr:tRNA lysidine(34) synthetase TilS [Rickettsiaceae bacterium]
MKSNDNLSKLKRFNNVRNVDDTQNHLSKFVTKAKSLGLDNFGKLCICVSGGSDSMGLLTLANAWAESKNIKIYAVTVDHALRVDSSKEAEQVNIFCTQNNIAHEILTWEHDEITAGVQEKAREARYKLICDWCKKNNIEFALTGHIFEDQVEQIIMSIAHGNAIYKFLIPELSVINGINFIRPILDFQKFEIQEFLLARNISWIDDPSNHKELYFRNKIRPLANKLILIANKKRMEASIENIRRVSHTLNFYSEYFLNNHFHISKLFYGTVDFEKYITLPPEIRLSCLASILRKISKKTTEIRLESLKHLDKSIFQKAKSSLLGTCAFVKTIKLSALSNKAQKNHSNNNAAKATKSNEAIGRQVFSHICENVFTSESCNQDIEYSKIYFIRDFGKEYIQSLEADGIWDNRFQFEKLGKYKICRLKASNLDDHMLKDDSLFGFDHLLTKSEKKSILLGLPGLFLLEKLISIPHIYYTKYESVDEIFFRNLV